MIACRQRSPTSRTASESSRRRTQRNLARGSNDQRNSAVWVNHDIDLMDVTVKGSGETAIIHATQRHPFWDATTNTWTEARHLKPGDRLRTSDGRAATVAATVVVSGDRDMWDLTVAADHDFYVATPVADVLVHNNSCRKFGFADAPRIADVYTITLKRGNAYKVYVGASASNATSESMRPSLIPSLPLMPRSSRATIL